MYGDRRDFITGAVTMVLLSGCENLSRHRLQAKAPRLRRAGLRRHSAQQLAGSIQRSLSGTRM